MLVGAMLSDEDLSRRMKAARAVAGFRTVEQLADAIGQEGLSAQTLRSMEQRRRAYTPRRDFVAIAEACGLTVEWFEVDDLGEAIHLGALAIVERDGALGDRAARTRSAQRLRQYQQELQGDGDEAA